MKPKLLVEQKITPFANKYSIYQATESGSKGSLIAVAQQKRLAFKEKVIFYTDEQKSKIAFSFRAEKVLDVHGRYFVEDQSGVIIGGFKKEFTKSLINSTWNILDTNGQATLQLRESNQTLAILRRFGSLVPVVGVFIELITSILRYHFEIIDVTNAELVGRYEKTRVIRDHYTLSMNNDSYASCDWRLLAAMAVALDALQSR